MVKIYIFGLMLMLLMLVAACDNFTSEPRFDGDVYAISGLLISDSIVSMEHPIYITKSSTIENFNSIDLFVADASVTLTDLTSNTSWSLTPAIDMIELKVKWIDENDNVIQGGHKYRIDVTIPGYDKTIWAETTVPPSVMIDPDFNQYNLPTEGYSLSETAMVPTLFDTIDSRYPLAINTGSVSGAFNFMTELFCLEEFSTDLEFTTPVFGFTHASEDMESSYYSNDESVRRIKIMGRYVSKGQAGYADNYLLVRDYKQAFVFYGRYRVSSYITDDNYYKYNFMPEGYLHGGVHNALGYFGSASGGVMYIKIVKN